MKLLRLSGFVGNDKKQLVKRYEFLRGAELRETSNNVFARFIPGRKPVELYIGEVEVVGPVQMWVLVIEEIGRERITMTAWEPATADRLLGDWLWEHWTPEDAAQFGPAVRQELTQDIIDEWFNLYDFEYQYHIDLTEVQ